MGAIVCCVCADKAEEALEKPLVEALSVLQDEQPPMRRADSQATLAPS